MHPPEGVVGAAVLDVDQGLADLHGQRAGFGIGVTDLATVPLQLADGRDHRCGATGEDLDDLANRLMRQLMGVEHAPKDQLPDNAILVARMMGPAALLDYDRKKLRGLILEEGGATSHVAIVARAIGIPAVGEVENASGLVEAGDPIIVDGITGEVYLRPQPDIEAAYIERVKLRARRQGQICCLAPPAW